jgi:hypothetical protein
MSRTTFNRQDCAEIWHAGLSDREREHLVEQFEREHGGVGIAPPTPLELFSEFNAGTISLEHKTTSREP